MPKIADLYAELSLKTDRTSFGRARDDLGRFVKGADKEFKGLGSRMASSISDGLKSIRSDLNSGLVKRVGLGAIGAGLVLAAKDSLKFEDSLVRLNVASRGAMGSMEDVRQRVMDVSKETAVGKDELLAGANAFIALTGDGKAAAEMLDLFGKAQVATNASMEDISAVAASMSQNLGLTSAEMEKGFSIMISGGKAGAIEMKDMAGLMAGLAAQSKQFAAGTGLEGTAKISAALQIARQDFGSAAEAATGLEAIMGSMIQNADKLKKEGVNVFGADGKSLRDMKTIIEELAKKGLNQQQLIDIFGRKEALRAFNALTKVDGAWQKMIDDTLKANDVQEDYFAVSQSASHKVNKSFNDIKLAIADVFTPERLQGFAKILGGIVEAASRLVGMLEAVSDWYQRNNVTKSDEGGPEAKLSDKELDERLGMSDFQLAMAHPGQIRARLEDERKRRAGLRTQDLAANATLAASETVAQVNWAAGGGKGAMPDFGIRGRFGAPTLPAGGNGAVTVNAPANVNVTVNAKTDADANSIASMVTKHIRRAFDAQARDIAAGAAQ